MIRKATYEDLPALMEIFRNAREIMRKSGNRNQWNDSYPSEETVRKDIDNGVCMVLCEDADSLCGQNKIIAVMSFIPGPDPTYAVIHEGNWPDRHPYHVIHRIAAAEPGHDAAQQFLDWGFSQTGCIRIDTHEDNVIMHHILRKYGFTKCGIIYLANGSPREAYHMNISNRTENDL